MAVVIHFSEPQMILLLNVLNKKKWEYKLHIWVQNVSKYSKNFQEETVYWVVCWKSDDGPLTFKEIDETSQRYAKNTTLNNYMTIYKTCSFNLT